MNCITLALSWDRYLEMVQMWDCKSHPYKLCVMVNNLEILLSTCQTKLTIIRRLTVSVIRSPSFACNPCMFYIFPCFELLCIDMPTYIQALFRKIAAALPGMETLSSTKQEDIFDVNLRSSGGYQSQPQSGGCAC